MMYEIEGRVLVIGEIESVGKKGFKKRTIVIDDNPDGDYHGEIPFEASGERLNIPATVKVGDDVKVGFFVDGRGWDSPKDGKRHYFPTLKLAKLDLVTAGATADNEPEDEPEATASDDTEDIPF